MEMLERKEEQEEKTKCCKVLQRRRPAIHTPTELSCLYSSTVKDVLCYSVTVRAVQPAQLSHHERVQSLDD
jgi:hypothetical protein